MTTQSSKQKRGCLWWLGVVLKLSSNNKQIIAEKSEHFIQLQQPQLVIVAVVNILNVTRK